MALSIATWNINSVRLRMPLVEHFLEKWQPDILCLQETKCPNDQFPSAPLKSLGYKYIEMHGQKGYHGVATVSRLPLTELTDRRDYCGVGDARHLSVVFEVGGRTIRLHNFYVPAGGDEPDFSASKSNEVLPAAEMLSRSLQLTVSSLEPVSGWASGMKVTIWTPALRWSTASSR